MRDFTGPVDLVVTMWLNANVLRACCCDCSEWFLFDQWRSLPLSCVDTFVYHLKSATLVKPSPAPRKQKNLPVKPVTGLKAAAEGKKPASTSR